MNYIKLVKIYLSRRLIAFKDGSGILVEPQIRPTSSLQRWTVFIFSSEYFRQKRIRRRIVKRLPTNSKGVNYREYDGNVTISITRSYPPFVLS